MTANLPYFFEDFTDGTSLFLSEANTHHIMNVLRMRNGEQFWITNGKGSRARVLLKNISKKNADIEVLDFSKEEQNSPLLHIGIAFTKNNTRMEWFLEKATELGIGHITPLTTQRGERPFFKRERFEKILVSAMLQSKQVFLPQLHEPETMAGITTTQHPQKFIAYCGEAYEKQALSRILKPGLHTLILIGPEGDFTPDEVSLCTQHQFDVVQLGENRLRTETAGLYVCTLFNALQ